MKKNSWWRNWSRLNIENAERGMTLIEIIIVIALLGTLMTILVRSLTSQQDEAMKDQARLAMGSLQQSLQMYRVHNRKFPPTLDDLVRDSSGSQNWRGPYIEENKLKDPWGTAFGYESDGKNFKIISPGPDIELGTSDDISYPEEATGQGGSGGAEGGGSSESSGG